MDKIELLKGVVLTPLKRISNPLGDVFHGMKKSDEGFNGFEEAYFSTIHHDIIKSWKRHTKMTLNIIVPVGSIRFALFDDRENSETNGKYMDVTLSLDNYYRLTVPPNIWMTFKGVGNSLNLLLNISNLEHDPAEVDRDDSNMKEFSW